MKKKRITFISLLPGIIKRKFFFLLLIECLFLFSSKGFCNVFQQVYSKIDCAEKKVTYINPYIVNIYCIYILKNNPNKENIYLVKSYMNWYLEHLNYPDRWGLTGTIYDYKINSYKREVPTYFYDSADAYAGTFLILLYEYINISGDKDFFIENLQKIKDIAYIIIFLIDNKDGVIKALPNSKTKYLIDNIEAYIGLKKFLKLIKIVDKKEAVYYYRFLKNLKKDILKNFYNRRNKFFYWAINDVQHVPNFKKFYPDLFSQLIPVVYNFCPPEAISISMDKIKVLLKHKKLPCEQRLILQGLLK